ncbi:MAG: Mur ligase family protein [Thermodesulfobacteriota bacterium]
MRLQTFINLPTRLSTPLGRTVFKSEVLNKLWPLFLKVTPFYRSIFLKNTRIVTVVGSYGKTTTTRAISKLLKGDSEKINKRNHLSHVATAVLSLKPSDKYDVIEVGINGPGQMKRYTSIIRPDITVVTNIGSDHSRSLTSLDITRDEKAHMVRALSSGGVAVLNGDDPNVMWMKEETNARIITFGMGKDNDIRATSIKLDWPHGTNFTLHFGGKSYKTTIKLIGAYHVSTILTAVAVGEACGMNTKESIDSLKELTPTTGRMQPVLLNSGAYLLRDDFKSGIETIEAALNVFAKVPAKRRITVIGEIEEPRGSQGPLYKKLGKRLASISDSIIVLATSRNYNSYTTGTAPGKKRKELFIHAGESIRTAVELIGELGPGDVVLIKGRQTQGLSRVAHLLMGRKVGCDLTLCKANFITCDRCPMLEYGWGAKDA